MTEWLPEHLAAAEREAGTPFDLTACVREPIHRLGGVQSYGALIAVKAGRITVASENAAAVLGFDLPPDDSFLTGEQWAMLWSLVDADTGQTATMPVQLHDRRFDVTVHLADGHVVLEFEPTPGSPEVVTMYAPVRRALTRLQRAGTVGDACRAAVREIREITGYDRVVAYRFESADGPGEVIAEEVVDDWEPWLGLWFPATDIPPQARRLYEQNWIRVIADVDDTTARLVPAVLPGTGEPLDLSLSVLRTVSPFHLEYLRNIGVTASMSVSLLDGGRLWGLIACHGRAPKALSPQTRAACEFFGVALSLHLAALRERDEAAARDRSREVIARLLERYSTDLPARWSQNPAGLDQVIGCDAVVVRIDGVVSPHGVDAEQAGRVLAGLSVPAPGEVWHSDTVDGPFPGALVLPFGADGDCIVWLRRERTVTRRWAADPSTPVVLGPHGQRLTPRGSTAVFLASVRGRSAGWTTTDLVMAVELGRAVMGVAVAQARQLALLNVDLDSFAHAAAHDLKEPLRGIANTSTFIIEDAADGMDPVTLRRLESIQRLATRMDELLNALLDYSRLGRTELDRSPVLLSDAVARALEVAGPRLSEAAVTVDIADTSVSLTADPVLLEQVLVNLLVNAGKYARPGGGTVTVGLSGDALFVRDDGIGMPAHLREQAFQLFRRLHPEAGRDGSGAGLAIVRRIAERHGGQAWAGESPGGGTTVWVTFGSRDRQ
ncbi:bacteriophytochrome [Paractinoplanes abujensis]|uniref:Sensor-like histidine kinase SenX3 n=1 Tax=Paractinoplanes abujensis TaxID=882441 RepID=A0A7W7CNF6_9ACTN|nr:ATP-binding protein [Actinoplanes abujensis]MBB4691770.1 light-regulated signal transduction histidine kinase (bacteriophytochrome) [Actinoplanes abujensis]GID16807.1 bacteriophytochrome [Actinoplanes abujensis]